MAIQLCEEGLWALLIPAAPADICMIHHTPIATSALPPSVPRWLKSNQVHDYCMDKPRISYPLHHTGPLTFSQNSKSCACVCLIHFAGWQIMTFMPFFSYSEFSASLTKESKNQKKITWYKLFVKCKEHNNFKQKQLFWVNDVYTPIPVGQDFIWSMLFQSYLQRLQSIFTVKVST